MRSPVGGARRAALVAVGCLSVVLAAIGAVVPGMPTTVFLIVASYCFARSVPALEQRLLRGRLFAPYMPFVDGRAPMPRRARMAAAGLLWASLGLSLASLLAAGRLPPWLAGVLVTAGLVGTVAIFRYGVRPTPPGADAVEG